MCTIILPRDIPWLTSAVYGRSSLNETTLTTTWDTPVGHVYTCCFVTEATSIVSAAHWQDMLEQVQIYVRQKEKAK